MRVVALLAAMTLTCSAGAAPQQRGLNPDQRVRVTAPEMGVKKLVGTIETVNESELVVGADASFRIPITAITRLEVHHGVRSVNFLKSIGIGFAVGAALGTAVGLASDQPGPEISASTWALVGAGIGGGVGLTIGTVYGALAKTDHWEEVSLDHFRVRVVPRREGIGMAMRLAF